MDTLFVMHVNLRKDSLFEYSKSPFSKSQSHHLMISKQLLLLQDHLLLDTISSRFNVLNTPISTTAPIDAMMFTGLLMLALQVSALAPST
jgi:hypothetical protein